MAEAHVSWLSGDDYCSAKSYAGLSKINGSLLLYTAIKHRDSQYAVFCVAEMLLVAACGYMHVR